MPDAGSGLLEGPPCRASLAVQELRGRRAVSQTELADRAGLERSYLSALENGRSNTAMRALMRAFRELDLELVVRP